MSDALKMENIHLKIFEKEDEIAYTQFIAENPAALFYHSIAYKNFLCKILTDSQEYYILAYENDNLVGILPSFIKRSPLYGRVLNSLPFFGSHGGILLASHAANANEIKSSLIEKFCETTTENDFVSATIVDNLFEQDENFYQDNLGPHVTDKRIGQLTNLSVENPFGDIEDQLMQKFHSKTRNLVRKGQKSGFHVYHAGGKENFKTLQAIHEQNMKAIGGTPKPVDIFYAIDDSFIYDRDYRIYFAEKDGECAAALLVFYFKDYCEYFTPVIAQQFRSEQPLSLLIFHAMLDAITKGCCWWNWGGTHLSQENLYHFKSRWGAIDKIYHYYTKKGNNFNVCSNKIELLSSFPYFYVRPFNLESDN